MVEERGPMSGISPRLRRVLSVGSVVAGLVLLLPIEAPAQYGRTSWTIVKLTASDKAIVRKIYREDFSTEPNGTAREWSNPESQNSGKLTLIDRFTSKGRDCRKVRLQVKPGPKQPAEVIPANYVLTSCRLQDGSWK